MIKAGMFVKIQTCFYYDTENSGRYYYSGKHINKKARNSKGAYCLRAFADGRVGG